MQYLEAKGVFCPRKRHLRHLLSPLVTLQKQEKTSGQKPQHPFISFSMRFVFRDYCLGSWSDWTLNCVSVELSAIERSFPCGDLRATVILMSRTRVRLSERATSCKTVHSKQESANLKVVAVVVGLVAVAIVLMSVVLMSLLLLLVVVVLVVVD